MKKYLMTFLTMALAAGTAFAQEGGPGPNGPPDQPGTAGMNGPPGNGQPARGADQSRPGEAMSPEMQNQMRADQRAIAQLGEAARAATDPAEKAKIVEQLRAKLNEIASRVQTHHEERIAQAEKYLENLRDNLQKEKDNRAGQIEEQIQRILSGELPRQPPDQSGGPGAPNGQRGGNGQAASPNAPGQLPFGGMPPPPPSQNPDAQPSEGQPPPPSTEGMLSTPPPASENMPLSPPPGEDMPEGVGVLPEI